MSRILTVLAVLLFTALPALAELPAGFVRVSDTSPTITQEIRYHGSHNFLGRPVRGYLAPQCILTEPAAQALAAVQEELTASGLSLKIYDCYRPARAVADFVEWAAVQEDQATKAEFYPDVDKADFFELGYVAKRSGHSRGSTVDVTIVPLPTPAQPAYTPGQPLASCYAPKSMRFADNTIDMGTGYDCFDELSHPANKAVGIVAYHNRQMLLELMNKHGFVGIDEEWWHFTLQNEPYPDTYFDFVVD